MHSITKRYALLHGPMTSSICTILSGVWSKMDGNIHSFPTTASRTVMCRENALWKGHTMIIGNGLHMVKDGILSFILKIKGFPYAVFNAEIKKGGGRRQGDFTFCLKKTHLSFS